MDLLPEVLISLVIIGGLVYMFMRQNRERAGNAPLRDEIAARVCFETTLDRASFLGTGGFGGTRGVWIRLRGPKRLIVGTDAFMVSAPQALSEFVFRGSESSIAFGQAVNPGDCIMITGQAGGRQVQLAITGGNLPDIWQALAGTGAAFVLRVVNSESFRLFEVNRDGVSGRLPGVFSWRLRCVMGVLCRGCRRCGRACADLPGYGIRMPGGLRAWRAGSGSRRWRS